MTDQLVSERVDNQDDAKEIAARYRAYCDACQSGQLAKVPSFWSLPALFTVDTGQPETAHIILGSPEELIAFYSQLFGPTTGVDQTIIDTSEVTFYGPKLATIETTLRHMVGPKLHDKQKAIYGCRKVGGAWVFISHLSVDITD